MQRNELREFDRAARSVGWRVFMWSVIAVVAVGLIGGGIYWAKVASAPVKGWGDEQIVVNDGRNRVNAQEWFAGKYGFVKGQDAKLAGMKANLEATKGTPDESLWRSSFTGAQNLCLQAIEEYNAEANKVSRGRWRSPDLPFALPDGESTDCRESTR